MRLNPRALPKLANETRLQALAGLSLTPKPANKLANRPEGYYYAGIAELTGWTYTKVNRCLAEGRQRFREMLGKIEEGRRCEELSSTLSAFADGEVSLPSSEQLVSHLRACGPCRAKLRAYRAIPKAAALAPLPATVRPGLGARLHDITAAIQARIPRRGGATDAAVTQIAASGGPKGAGMAAVAKVLAVCAGTASGAAACVAAGVAPPIDLASHPPTQAKQVAHRSAVRHHDEWVSGTAETAASPIGDSTPAPQPVKPASDPAPDPAAQPASTVSEFTPEAPAAPPVARASIGEFGGAGGGGSTAGGGGSGGEFGP